MAFQTPITIRRAIEHVQRQEYVLPAIQREFIWNIDQITRLFDSLMRGYPIGSFLFWKVDRDHYHDYKFYGFLNNYHERDQRHNPPVPLTGEQGVTAILDGQQRLTSLYIGLGGTYTFKTKRKRWNNPDAFPKRRLYLNLLEPASDEEIELKYDFRFLTDSEIESDKENHWFLVGDILKFSEFQDINRYLRANELINEEYPENCLYNLYQVICERALINFYQEEDQNLDKVLNIFIRVNSGGTQLSYSDLLLSISTAQWTTIDAREAIHELVDDLNNIGDGFYLNKDFVLKSCLVLADIPNIGFRVDNFTRDNTKIIESMWPQIADALRFTVALASRFGYNGDTLTANNVLIPIAYYIFARQLSESYIERQEFSEDRDAVHKWIARALLKSGTFGSGLDTTLRTARLTVQNNSGNSFPTQQMDTAFSRIGKTLRFEEEELDDLLDHTYGNRTTFSVLALLYPGVDFANRFHEDHIFPRSRFHRRRLLDAGVPEDQISEFQDCQNRLGNLQLIEGIQNQEKSAKMPLEWLQSRFSNDDAGLDGWKARHFLDGLDIPEDISGFIDFYEARREKMKKRLAQILDVTLST